MNFPIPRQLSIPSNIPKGTFFGDGLRAGPSYSSLLTTQADSNGILLANDYNDFGPGILYSPQFTWNIVPYPGTAANIVAAAEVTVASWLTLTQDTTSVANGATTLIQSNVSTAIGSAGNNYNRYVQFDWPRVPAVVVAGAAMAGPTNVTIFGTDWYGFPLQMTYLVEATGTYPANLGSAAKAFYTVTGVRVNGATGGGGTLAVQTTNIFGLPYCVKEWSDVMNFSWDGNNMTTQVGGGTLVAGELTVSTPAIGVGTDVFLQCENVGASTAIANLVTPTASIVSRTSFLISSRRSASPATVETNDISTVSWMIPQGGQNLFKVADTTTATGLTGDTRGLFMLPGTGETWANVPNGVRRALFTAYSMGSDQFQNQLANGGQPQGALLATTPPLTAADLYGVQQYYTGVPA